LNPRPPPCQELARLDDDRVNEYLNIKALSGVSDSHLYETRRFLKHYLRYVDYNIDKEKSIEYFGILLEKHKISTYRKTVYQILKFLRFLNVDWIDVIKLPSEPTYIPTYIPKENIDKTFEFFSNHKFYLRFRAVILLGISSGIRAEELYQLNIDDIDLENRIVRINHNPKNGQTTKTKKSRISFFTEETKDALSKYFTYFDNGCELKVLFPQIWLERKFRNSPIRIKQLRKYFSQEWERRGGSTGIKKLLMGHSLRKDVDLMHYNYQSEKDLKRIYDKIMGK
jgi:integrase/recombinase XerD